MVDKWHRGDENKDWTSYNDLFKMWSAFLVSLKFEWDIKRLKYFVFI